MEIAPRDKDVEEHNLDRAVFASWFPHCVTGRAESNGYARRVKDEGTAPTIGGPYTRTHSEQEKGVPTIAIKDSKTKMIMAKVAPRKGIENYAVEVVKKRIEQLGHKKVNFRSDNEPVLLELKTAVRRESDVEIVLEQAPDGDHKTNGLVESAVANAQD